jgi:O-antigen/teichoic acid export membrane protein
MSLLRSSTVLLIAQIGSSALTALNFFVLAANFSANDFGAWSILLTLPVVIVAFSSFGYSKAAIYYLGQSLVKLETAIGNGVIICVALEGLVGLATRLAEPAFRQLFPDVPFALLFIMLASAPIQLLLLYISEISLATNLLGLVAWAKASPVVIYVGGCFLAAITGKLTLSATVIIFVSAMAAGAFTSLLYLFVGSKMRRAFLPNLAAFQQCVHFGWRLQIGEISQYLSNRIDLLFVGYWAGTVASGYYAMAVRLAEIVWYISNSAQLALSVKVAQIGEREARARLVQRTTRYVLLISLVAAVMIALASAILLPLLLARYTPALRLLILLLPGTVAFAMFQVLVGGFIGEGQPALVTQLRLFLFVLSLAFYLLLIPPLGSVGASLGTTLAYGAGAVAASLIATRVNKLPLSTYVIWQSEDWLAVNHTRTHLTGTIRKWVARFSK